MVILADKINGITLDLEIIQKHINDNKIDNILQRIEYLQQDWEEVVKDLQKSWDIIALQMMKLITSPTKKSKEEKKALSIFFERYGNEDDLSSISYGTINDYEI